MKSYGLAFMLRDDPAAIAAYKRHHRNVWPEVAARLNEVGIREMRIYLLGRRLFMYVKAIDSFEPRRDFSNANEGGRLREWDQLMSTMLERPPDSPPDELLARMEEVFDLGWSRG
jgi:L-rhamnose mutarotase